MPAQSGYMYVNPRSPGKPTSSTAPSTERSTPGRRREGNGGSKEGMNGRKTSMNLDPLGAVKDAASAVHRKGGAGVGAGARWKELLWLLPIVTLWPWWCAQRHYDLPEPVMDGSPIGMPPQASEPNALHHVLELERIGYRTVGTQPASDGEKYVYDVVKTLEKRCNEAGFMDCQVWWQVGDGFHQFDILDHAVLKTYQGISNIILRIADKNSTTTIDGSPMKNAILLNAHIDSALPSRGSADDAIGVGVMLECARVIIERDQPIKGAAIFLFNGAEETLQDASHLYSTQHETAPTVKAVINLEAAGSTGPALLFQATSKEMIEAYSQIPRPHGTVVAADIFSSGVIGSDTDFVQFEKYLNVSGLDTAIVGHSYFYHTRKDLAENMTPGSAQHFLDSTMAVLDFLLKEGSPLLTDTPWSPPNLAYYSLYDRVFFYYSMRTADILSVSAGGALVILAVLSHYRRGAGIYTRAAIGTFGGFFASIFTNVALALFLHKGLDRGQTWFTHEQLPMVLYGPPALLTSLSLQYFLHKKQPESSSHIVEHAGVYSSILLPTVVMTVMQIFRIRSAYLFLNMAILGVATLVLSEGSRAILGRRQTLAPFVATYVPWSLISVAFAVEAATNFLDIFTPLTGRMGREAPTEIIIAVIVTFCTGLFLPFVAPFFLRWSRRQQKQILIAVLTLSVIIVAVFASPRWKAYDARHPKRIGVQYLYNVSSGEVDLHVAQLDSGPGFPEILESIHDRYGLSEHPPTENIPSDTNSDWDVLYPISAFIEAHQFVIEGMHISADQKLPEVKLELIEDEWDAVKKERTIKLHADYTGMVYPVISFTAEVITWDFVSAPPVGRTRHYVKSACSAQGRENFDLVMTLKGEHEHERLDFSWVGIDVRQLYPATAMELGADLPATQMFHEMDQWMEKKWEGSLEVLMIGSVGGVVTL